MESHRRVHREVVSYVRRSARMNPSQQQAWDRLAGKLVIPVLPRELSTSIHPDAQVDWVAVFGRTAPLLVEIGSGRGEALVALAEQHPEANVVGFEVFQPAVASTLSRINRAGVTHARVVMANAVEGLSRLFAPSTLTEVWTFFPDPWHKTRHHKRRIVNPDVAALVSSRLMPAGLWRLATDWADYATSMRTVLDSAPDLENVHPGWAPRFAERPLTKYEARGLEAGRTVYDLTYRRTPVPQPTEDLVQRTTRADAQDIPL
ncbi:MAG: tRNA (guanosine(46)-N7)-methyltransferase TrmB [Propioniciclava sp.]